MLDSGRPAIDDLGMPMSHENSRAHVELMEGPARGSLGLVKCCPRPVEVLPWLVIDGAGRHDPGWKPDVGCMLADFMVVREGGAELLVGTPREIGIGGVE